MTDLPSSVMRSPCNCGPRVPVNMQVSVSLYPVEAQSYARLTQVRSQRYEAVKPSKGVIVIKGARKGTMGQSVCILHNV